MKKLLLLAAVAATAMTASAQDVYIIGANVNGGSWNDIMGAADCKMTPLGDGVYQWKGEKLGTGFKFNDGTWNNSTFEGTDVVANIGSNGDVLEVGEEYFYNADASSADIKMNVDLLVNPTVTLDLNQGWVKVEGQAEDVVYDTWYLCGDITSWDNPNDFALEKDGDSFSIKGVDIAQAGTCLFTVPGWSVKYGMPYPEVSEDAEETEVPAFIGAVGEYTLVKDGADITIDLVGTFDITFTPAGDTAKVVFAPSQGDGVAAVETAQADAVYYNLQGVRVANPTKGIYVKVVGNKALKAVVK